uniref:Uncharacterized protein n=1 Tax=Oryza punctata TaxID=4537 RepID=A0A0E0KXZ8_ORYPU
MCVCAAYACGLDEASHESDTLDLMEKPKKAKFLFDDDDVDGEGEKDQDKQNNKGNDQGKNETPPVNRAKEWPRVNYRTRGLPTEASSKNRSSGLQLANLLCCCRRRSRDINVMQEYCTVAI